MKPTHRKSWAGNLLRFSDFNLGPPSRSNNGSVALVSCLSVDTNLHRCPNV